MKIVFATNNQHKLEEIRQILGEKFEVLSRVMLKRQASMVSLSLAALTLNTRSSVPMAHLYFMRSLKSGTLTVPLMKALSKWLAMMVRPMVSRPKAHPPPFLVSASTRLTTWALRVMPLVSSNIMCSAPKYIR